MRVCAAAWKSNHNPETTYSWHRVPSRRVSQSRRWTRFRTKTGGRGAGREIGLGMAPSAVHAPESDIKLRPAHFELTENVGGLRSLNGWKGGEE